MEYNSRSLPPCRFVRISDRAARALQVIEIKNKYGETPARIKVFYQWIDVYVKFLTLQVRVAATHSK